jgi:hypothetical protein
MLRAAAVGVVFAISSFAIVIAMAYVRCLASGVVFDFEAIWFIALKGSSLIGFVVTIVTAIGAPGPREGP